MYEYQPAITREDFKDTNPPSDKPKQQSLRLSRQQDSTTTGGQTDVPFCELVKLWVETPGKKGPEDKSFTEPNESVPSDSEGRWHFAPKVETAKVFWELKGRFDKSGDHMADATTLKFEIFTRKSEKSFWSKEIKWNAGKCPKRGYIEFGGILDGTDGVLLAKEESGDSQDGSGDSTASPVAAPPSQSGGQGDYENEEVNFEMDDFPDGVLTVDKSPYKLKVSIVDAGGQNLRTPSRWVVIEVLVHSLELEWGEFAMLPKTRSDITDPVNLLKVLGDQSDPQNVKKGYEEIILEELKKANKEPVEGVVHEVKLMSNVFPFQKKEANGNVESYFKNIDFQQYRALWGEGARIPLVVKAYIQTSKANGANESADSDGKTDKVPEALGESKILWDWEEKTADRWKQSIVGTTAPKTEAFLTDAYDKNTPIKPVAKSNCPLEFGGKHGEYGGDKLVFPVQAKTPEFGFEVKKSTGRKWSSLSSFGTDKKRGESGVIFQPSRFAGDSFKIRGLLHFDRYSDSEDDIQAPAPVQTKSCEFKVFRRIKLHSLRRGNPNVDPSTLDNAVKTHYLKELDMEVEVNPIPVNNGAYTTALRTAVGRLCRKEHFVKEVANFPHIRLMCRFAVDLSPADGSPGVVFRNWTDIKNDIENLFKNHSMRVLPKPSEELFDEVVTGQTSGATGTILKIGDTSVVLFPSANPLVKGENIVGQLSNVTDPLEFNSSARSCWGHNVNVVSKTAKDDKIYKESIKVIFPNLANNNEVVITYTEKKGFGKKLTAELPESAKIPLQATFTRAMAAHNENNSFDITVNARTDSDNAKNRHANVKQFLLGLFGGGSIVDRKDYHERLLSLFRPTFKPTVRPRRPDGFYVFNECQRTMALLLIGETVWEYALQNHADEEGIFVLHIPGRYQGYNFGDDEVQKLDKLSRVQGAFYPELTGDTNSKPFRVRDRGVAYIATVGEDLSDGDDTKTAESIIKHELAHALFLPHAPFKVKHTPSSKAHCHVKNDDCLMNYDLESKNFCGFCIMRLRGWNWKSEIYQSVKSVKILNGNDTTFLTTPGVQYVNLPKEAKWVDPANTGNLDRLGRKVRVKVEFDPSVPGDKCFVQLYGHRNNSEYSDEEKARKASYNVKQENTDEEFGAFDRLVGEKIEGERDANDCFFTEVELPPAVGDRFKIVAWGEDYNHTESVELTTWRALYYMTITLGVVRGAIPLPNFKQDIEAVFTAEFTNLIHTGDEAIAPFPVDHEATDIVCDKIREPDDSPSGIPNLTYSQLEPYLLRYVFPPFITNCRDVTTLPFTVNQFGVGAPVVRVPLYQRRPPVVPDGHDYRRALWIGLGMPYHQSTRDLLTVPNNTWFIEVSIKFNDPAETVVQVPEAQCTPVEPDSLNQPGRYSELDVAVDQVNLPAGATSGDIVVKALFCGGMKGGWARIGETNSSPSKLPGGVIIPALDAKMMAQPPSKQMNSAVHEAGHALGMVANPKETGLDCHETHYTSQGDHCWYGLVPTKNTLTDGTGQEQGGMSDNADCVMFGHLLTGPRPHPLTDFCPNCKKVMRKIDISDGLH